MNRVVSNHNEVQIRDPLRKGEVPLLGGGLRSYRNSLHGLCYCVIAVYLS